MDGVSYLEGQGGRLHGRLDTEKQVRPGSNRNLMVMKALSMSRLANETDNDPFGD